MLSLSVTTINTLHKSAQYDLYMHLEVEGALQEDYDTAF